MDKEELDRIKAQSDEVIRGVVELQDQIKKYKSGAESFELAVGVLGGVAEREKEVVRSVEKYLEVISRTNIKKMIQEIREIEAKIEGLRDEYAEIEKKVLAQQKEERKLEREIKEFRFEIRELKELLEKTEDKKGRVFGLFRKR